MAGLREPLVEGVDYTVEDGRWVFTEAFLRGRGTCCESGCRHCPYGFVRPAPRADAPVARGACPTSARPGRPGPG